MAAGRAVAGMSRVVAVRGLNEASCVGLVAHLVTG